MHARLNRCTFQLPKGREAIGPTILLRIHPFSAFVPTKAGNDLTLSSLEAILYNIANVLGVSHRADDIEVCSMFIDAVKRRLWNQVETKDVGFQIGDKTPVYEPYNPEDDGGSRS